MPATELDALPVKNGFRLRGVEMTRIEAFTDAAFAFALTLLVVSLTPPTSFAALLVALQDIPAFLLSATLLMVFWWGHHEWSRRYGLDDGSTLVLSCGLVFTVLVYVYPLRFMFGLMMRWIGGLTGLPLGARDLALSGVADINRLFVVYGCGFVAMCLILVMLNLHAWRRRESLALDAVERTVTRDEATAWGILAAVGALSVALSALLPARWVGIGGWAYMLLPVLMPLFGARSRRRRLAAAIPVTSPVVTHAV